MDTSPRKEVSSDTLKDPFGGGRAAASAHGFATARPPRLTVLTLQSARPGDLDRGQQRHGNEMSSLTVVWRVPVLRLVLDFFERGFPARARLQHAGSRHPTPPV